MQELMIPAVGELHLRPSKGSRFHSRVDIFSLKQICLFIVRANSLNVQIRPPHNYFGINLPLGNSFRAKVGANYEEYSDFKAHFLSPERELLLDCPENFGVMACSLSLEGVEDYARKILQRSDISKLLRKSEFAMSNPAGVSLQRSLAQAWSRLHSISGPASESAVSEIEDDLMTQFVSLINTRAREWEKSRPVYLKKAEEYLCANLRADVTRAALSDAVGVPLRTLSWAFQKYNDTGPMGFLKQRRFEAAYRDLLSIEPGAKSITDVALDYNFLHMGKFAIEYKQAFGESPSVTLSRLKR